MKTTLVGRSRHRLIPQPQTIDSTSNKTTLDSFNQEHMVAESYGFQPHPMPTLETSSQNQLQESTTSTPTLMTEPLIPQLVTPATPPITPQDQIQPSPITKPDNWNQMSKTQQRNWLKRNLPRKV